MTRKEATAIILSIAQGPRELTYVEHFWESSSTRRFTAQDVRCGFEPVGLQDVVMERKGRGFSGPLDGAVPGRS